MVSRQANNLNMAATRRLHTLPTFRVLWFAIYCLAQLTQVRKLEHKDKSISIDNSSRLALIQCYRSHQSTRKHPVTQRKLSIFMRSRDQVYGDPRQISADKHITLGKHFKLIGHRVDEYKSEDMCLCKLMATKLESESGISHFVIQFADQFGLNRIGFAHRLAVQGAVRFAVQIALQCEGSFAE